MLFDDFEAVSAKAWKQKIQVDLKGLDYNDTLIWKSPETIAVKPFYHADDFTTIPKNSNTKATEWKIGEIINVTISDEANIKAINAIARGVNHIIFCITSKTVSLKDLLKDINLDHTTITVKCDFISEKIVKNVQATSLRAIEKSQLYLHTDIINNLAKTGNWFINLKEDHKIFETLVKTTKQISVDLSLYQNAGANIIQQLAYGLAHVNEYLNHLDTILTKESKQTLNVIFNASVGSNYFFEIAKLRALRQLWTILATEYNINKNCTIHTQPSKRNKTIYDYNTNMLRTTTECMSAILGGANTACNLPYDAIYHHSNAFGDRISCNQLLVLKHESYFDKVNNPADGSYYIESLTNQISEKALKLFKDIEKNKGFLYQLKEGTIQRKIKESATKEQADFNTGKLVILGSNKYPNPKDKMKQNLEINPFLEIKKRKTLIEPIIEKRLSENLEINRLQQENNESI